MDASIYVALIGAVLLVLQERLARRREDRLRQTEVDRAIAERDEASRERERERAFEREASLRQRADALNDAWRTERLSVYRDFRVTLVSFSDWVFKAVRDQEADIVRTWPGSPDDLLDSVNEAHAEVALLGGPEVVQAADIARDEVMSVSGRLDRHYFAFRADGDRDVMDSGWLLAELGVLQHRYVVAARTDLGTDVR